MSYKVLTIEDEPAIRKSFSAYLEDYDYVVAEAADGREGIEKIEAETPDLVLADLRMPNVDGLSVLEYMKERRPRTPVIVVSGTGNIQDVVEALRLGAWDYLLKPVEDLDMLRFAVERALEKHRLEEENIRYRRHLEEEVRKKTEEAEEKSRRIEELNNRLKEVVLSVTSLSTINEPELFGREMLEKITQHISADGGAIYLRDEKGLRLLAERESGEAPRFIPSTKLDESLLSRVLETGELLHTSPQRRTPVCPGCTRSFEGDAGSCLLFPIPSHEEQHPMGIITIHRWGDAARIEQEKELGTLMAAFCAEGLRAAISFAQLRAHEESLRESLEEKNVLLRELHHRVKNNMQIIMSLLNLQRPSYRDEIDGRLVEKSIKRVQSMALVHDHLYRAETLTKVDLQSYVDGMLKEILRGSPHWHSGIEITTDLDGVELDLEEAVPIGLVMHELIDNALVHAFPGWREGRVEIHGECKSGAGCRITIRDDGVGLDESVDPQRAESLGFLLVQTLVHQVEGRLDFSGNGGTEFVLEFPGRSCGASRWAD